MYCPVPPGMMFTAGGVEHVGLEQLATVSPPLLEYATTGRLLPSNVTAVFYMFGLAVGNATGVLIAQAVGARDFRLARHTGFTGMRIMLAISVCAGVLISASTSRIVGFYSHDAQVQALEVIRDRRLQTLATLQERLRRSEAQSTAAAAHDTLTLMQDAGRLQVLSAREALQQLSPAQRRRWVELQAQRTP